MRTAWNVISFLAVVHLLAIAMFLGWLWQTDRLDASRLQEVRLMFAVTLTEAEAAAELAAQEAEAQRQRQLQQALRDNPPLSSAARIDLAAYRQQQAQRSVLRLDDVKKQLLQELAQAVRETEQQQAALEAERRNWRASIEAQRQRAADAQFAKAVKLLESLPPKQAKQKIVELVDLGQTEQAVAYLDAMNQRAAGKLFAEFKTDQENKLATELLERLRTFGLNGNVAEDSRDANAVANAG